MNLLSKYPPNVRLINDVLQNAANEGGYCEDIKTAARDCADQFPDILHDLQGPDLGSEIASKIFTLRPSSPESRQPVLTIPTHFLAGTLGIALSQKFSADRLSAFRMLDGHSTLRSAAGWIFENMLMPSSLTQPATVSKHIPAVIPSRAIFPLRSGLFQALML